MSRVLKNAKNQITCAYGNGHGGIDLVKAYGQIAPVIAHTEGTVIEVRSDATGYEPSGSYGNYVKIRHQAGYDTLYAHLAAVYVKQGQYVNRGQEIGMMGATGYVTAAHLHFEVRKNGNRIDPTPYIDADLPDQYTVFQAPDGNWYQYKNGTIDYSCNSIEKNKYGWWKIVNGKVDFSYNGLEKNRYGWFFLQGGKVNFEINGLIPNQYGTWLVQKGKVNFEYSGNYVFSGSVFKIHKGQVV